MQNKFLPDESVSIINIPELPDDLHPERFLRFDKFPVEEIDQHVPLSRMKRVLPQLNNRAASFFWKRRFGHSANFSSINPCKCAAIAG